MAADNALSAILPNRPPINDFSFFTGVEKSPLAPYTDGNGDSRSATTTISSPGDAAASAAAAAAAAAAF